MGFIFKFYPLINKMSDSSKDFFSFGASAAQDAVPLASQDAVPLAAQDAVPLASQDAVPLASQDAIPFDKFKERFRIDETKVFGEGSFGTVFFGIDLHSNTNVAVKKINSNPNPKSGSLYLERIIQEIKIAMIFDSPHLCKVFGYSIDSKGFVYIIMEQIQGKDAFDYCTNNPLLGKKNPELVKKIIHDVSRGLATLHAAGFAHSDIKLDNVMLVFSPNNVFIRAVIIDFGFTMLVSDIPVGSQQGSICYCSHEMIKGGVQLTEKIDMWALGVIIFIFLHGYYPISSCQKDTRAESIEIYRKLKALSETIDLPLYFDGNKDVNFLRMICTRCLEFDQAARISAEELLAMLSQ
jgi:serine/threonine protein kinase